MLHYLFWVRRAWFAVSLLAFAVMLAACGGEQPPTVNPENTVSIAHTEGAATLVRAAGAGEENLPASFMLAQGDQIYTGLDQSATLQFPDGSTLQLGPDSHVLLFSMRPSDHVAVFRLLSGSVVSDLRSKVLEMQAYKELAISFRMVQADLTAVPHSDTGVYQLGFDGNVLKATVNAGEFDMRSGNQQATLPAGWQASIEPGKSLQVASLITPSLAAPSAVEAATATTIQIIAITPTRTPTEPSLTTETSPETDTATATLTPTPTPTRTPTLVQRTIIANTLTVAPTVAIVATPVPPVTERPERPPKPTNPPPPPNPPPPTNPPRPTEPPPTNPPQPTEPPTRPPPPPPDTGTPGSG